MFDKILVAVDGSNPSLHALEVAATVAKQNKAELTVLTVVPPVPPMVEGDMPHYAPDFSKDLRDSYTNMLNRHVKDLKEKHPNLKVEAVVTEGHPSRKIIEAACEMDDDLLERYLQGDSISVEQLLVSEKRGCRNSNAGMFS